MQVRREKISERMKFLQELVPGCSKVGYFDNICVSSYSILNPSDIFGNFQVTGKAVMLDEIINYVQSLQRQVEVQFL